MRYARLAIAAALAVAILSPASAFTVEPVPEWNLIFDRHLVTGVALVYDDAADRCYSSAPMRIYDRFLPASTFKILHSLIALETGVVSDETHVIPWDRTERDVAAWNRDMNMQEAIACSAVWFYQELARRIGRERMEDWVHRANYGNGETGDAIDSFWLDGKLRISALEQLNFMRRLKTGNLRFSIRNMDIVRNIIIRGKNERGLLRGKTGTVVRHPPHMGWDVGYVENTGRTLFFVTVTEHPDPAVIASAREAVTRSILHELDAY